jgi:hypothetical protein
MEGALVAEAPARKRLADVYGISRDVPLNYVPRPTVDGALIDALTRDKHIVVFGSSKQGKTCVRKYNLQEADYVAVTCSNRWDLGALHSAILKQAGYTIELSSTKTFEGHQKITAKLGGGFDLKIVSMRGEGTEETGSREVTDVETVPLELDPYDVNDIIRALEHVEFQRYIVLEDFHYLPDETQRDFAFALKAFHEQSSFCFIVVGVWLDENRLIQFNGDLTGRVIAVNADAWTEDELRAVIRKGGELLNIDYHPSFEDALVTNCFDSVSVVQEACYRACEDLRIAETQAEHRTVGDGRDAAALIQEVVNEQSARYNNFISRFSEGFMETELEMYKWLLLPVLTAQPDHLERGLMYAEMKEAIQGRHPRGKDLNLGNLTQALRSAASLQVRHGIRPLVLDYDESTRRLSVVDRGFLIWLGSQDRPALLTMAGLSGTD